MSTWGHAVSSIARYDRGHFLLKGYLTARQPEVAVTYCTAFEVIYPLKSIKGRHVWNFTSADHNCAVAWRVFVLDTQTISLQNKQSILLFPEVTVFSRVSVLKSRDFPSCCLNWRGRSTCALIYWQFTLRLLVYQDVHDQPIFDIPPSVGFRTHLKVPKLSSWWPLKKHFLIGCAFVFVHVSAI